MPCKVRMEMLRTQAQALVRLALVGLRAHRSENVRLSIADAEEAERAIAAYAIVLRGLQEHDTAHGAQKGADATHATTQTQRPPRKTRA